MPWLQNCCRFKFQSVIRSLKNSKIPVVFSLRNLKHYVRAYNGKIIRQKKTGVFTYIMKERISGRDALHLVLVTLIYAGLHRWTLLGKASLRNPMPIVINFAWSNNERKTRVNNCWKIVGAINFNTLCCMASGLWDKVRFRLERWLDTGTLLITGSYISFRWDG